MEGKAALTTMALWTAERHGGSCEYAEDDHSLEVVVVGGPVEKLGPIIAPDSCFPKCSCSPKPSAIQCAQQEPSVLSGANQVIPRLLCVTFFSCSSNSSIGLTGFTGLWVQSGTILEGFCVERVPTTLLMLFGFSMVMDPDRHSFDCSTTDTSVSPLGELKSHEKTETRKKMTSS